MWVFFQTNLMVIQFGYGLVFFLMGFGAALAGWAFRESRLAVTHNLPWLAAFGLGVGLAEWGVIFIPLQAAYLTADWLALLTGLHGLLLVGAYACLLVFGIRLLMRFEPVRGWATGALVIGLVACTTAAWLQTEPVDWPSAAHLTAAYMLGLPGAILAARGLLLQRRDVAAFYPRSARSLLVAAWAFILSVPLGPLAVPSTIGHVHAVWGIPVQLPLALGGLLLAWSLLSGLEALRVENARRVERAERREAMLEGRYKLAKELSDGVIQDLFAAAMLMGAAGLHLPPEEKLTLRQVEKQLQTVVDRLRVYVMDLEPARPDEADLYTGLQALVDDFRANSLLHATLDVDRGLTVGPEALRALYAVVQESLSNVRRHAQASLVTLSLHRQGDDLCLTVSDNGRGLGQESFVHGAGLERMARSAEALGGSLAIGPAPGGGTRVALTVPIHTHGNTKESSHK